MTKKTKNIFLVLIAGIYLFGSFFLALFFPKDDYSVSERRKLTPFPELKLETLLSGDFMTSFEEYSLDAFPFRDEFRSAKAISSLFILRQKNNNGLFVHDGYISKLDYKLSESSLENAANKFNFIVEKYLSEGNRAFFSIIPDKNHFLAEKSSQLSYSYQTLRDIMIEKTPMLEFVDIEPLLSLEDYYRTDTHWRNECIEDVALALGHKMGVELESEYSEKTLEKDFYGVYHGQLALPLPPEKLSYKTNDVIENALVTDRENNKKISVFDLEKANGNDMYDVFLSGPLSLVTIENPSCTTGKSLVVFRDSFGSSLAPYLVGGYEKITLVDIRYISSAMLELFVEFEGSDFLFLYSSMVLNNSITLK